MRVLHVIQEFGAGGAEGIASALAAAAEAEGHDVAVATARVQASARVRVYPLPLLLRRPGAVPGAVRALRRAICEWRPDLVHSHNPGMALITAIATGRGRSPPALVTMHGVAEADLGGAARMLRWSGLPVVACGPGVATCLRERGTPVERVIVNGIPPPPPPADRSAIERRWGLPPGSRLILATGRLVEQKNHELAVRALPHLPGTVLVIAGEGRLESHLRDLANRLGVGGRLILPGVVEDVRAVMAAADLVVHPSRWEGLPLALLESLASGTPVVATAVPGVRELARDGTEALLVAPNDLAALVSALRRLLGDARLGVDLAAAAAAAVQRYDQAEMGRAYLGVYNRLTCPRTTA